MLQFCAERRFGKFLRENGKVSKLANGSWAAEKTERTPEVCDAE